MTKQQLLNYLRGCIAFAEQPDDKDGLAYVRPEFLKAAIALIPADEPRAELSNWRNARGVLAEAEAKPDDWRKSHQWGQDHEWRWYQSCRCDRCMMIYNQHVEDQRAALNRRGDSDA